MCVCLCVAGRDRSSHLDHIGVHRSHPRVLWQASPCVLWMCPCLENCVDASGCLHLWMGMPFPYFEFPSAFVSPGPNRHCVPVMLCWGTNIWECSDSPVSGMTGAPCVPPPQDNPPGWGPGCRIPGRLGNGLGFLFLQYSGTRRKLHPLQVTGTFRSNCQQLPRARLSRGQAGFRQTDR